jgi:hypothetical protein
MIDATAMDMDISVPVLWQHLGISDRNIVRRAIEHRISWIVDGEGQRPVRGLVFGWARTAVGHDLVQSGRFQDPLYAGVNNADSGGLLVALEDMKSRGTAKDAELVPLPA